MTSAEFRWTDLNQLVSATEALVQRVALEVMAGAKRRAPVDTGTLQSSITAARLTATTREVAWQIGTNVHYAAFQEFGTRKMPAHPYMLPALAEAAAKYGGRIGS